MATCKIHASVRNGTVEFLSDRIVRSLKKRLGRDDTRPLPMRAVVAVHRDHRTGRDKVRVDTSGQSYEWKVTDGKSLVEELNTKMYAD